MLAEPSSGARRGGQALTAYEYLLEQPAFSAAHRPDVVVCAGRPGLTRGQLGFLRQAAAAGARQVMLASGPGRWADPARTATDVAAAVRLDGGPARARPVAVAAQLAAGRRGRARRAGPRCWTATPG